MTGRAARISWLMVLSFVLVPVGCVRVGPNYETPGIALTVAFAGRQATEPGLALNSAWWHAFQDPKLTELLARGAAQNLDVKTALARIARAESLLRTTGLNAQTSGDASKVWARSRVESLSVNNDQSSTYDAGFVIDLFGGFARDRERALAAFEAAQFDVGVARLAVLAEITVAYIEARYHQALVGIIQSAIESDRQTLDLVTERQRLGLSTQLQRQQAITRLASTEAELPIHRAQFDVQIFRLATLLNEPAQPLMVEMRAHQGQLRPLAMPKAGVPADLLRNRPDIRLAERNLAAATAAIGVAQAQLYPSLTLTGTVTIQDPRNSWDFSRVLVLPVLNRGKLLGNRDAKIAAAHASDLEWRSAVRKAVEEVQAALLETRAWSEQGASLGRATRAAQRLVRLTTEQYDLGQVALSEVLVAKRQLASSREKLANARRQYALAWTRTQVAAGYGWAAQVRPAEEINPPNAKPDPVGLKPIFVLNDKEGKQW